ncbi:AAA family ATPase [Umezawaea sp. Da 62-37]|uniref:AAA family ATPase n=1 Tax=Umezawaea sp. Da 62-37 TaxID=3075927 RepID=UPI0028F6F7B5|nr:AAA family ATPase [Umezawaea sp. Da 62-37]WNV89634.1 AAA family ATPase [Umezawaea sp. Da 62-37]
MPGTLIEFGGLPATGKSTLARHLANLTGAVLLRIDEIEAAMRRNDLTPAQTGITAYSVAHALASSHLHRGLTVIADAVNPVPESREGWRTLATTCNADHAVIETTCTNQALHRERAQNRDNDLPGWTHPTWQEIQDRDYRPRTDDRLIVDTAQPLQTCHDKIAHHLAAHHPTIPLPR